MKKIISLFIITIMVIININITNANNIENKLYKGVILTKFQINKDYLNGKSINKKIENLFIKYRYLKDKKSLIKLEKLLKTKLIEFKKNNSLSRADKKIENLYLNIYYRTTLLLDYNLK